MSEMEFLRNLLFVYSNITVIVDIKEKCIQSLYRGNDCIATNISFEEYAERFAEIFDLNEASKKKVQRFVENLNPNNQPFVQPASYESISKGPIMVELKGIRYEENKVILIADNYISSAADQYDDLTKVFTKEVILNKI